MELRIKIPSKLSELTANQLRFVSWLYLAGIPETEFLVKALLFFTGLRMVRDRDPEPDGARWFRHRSIRKPFLLDPDQLAGMTDLCKYLLKPDEVKPVRWIRFARARNYRLYNCTLDEYLMAENYYFAYVNTKDTGYLDNLISVLYRRPWQRWSSAKIQQRAAAFRGTSPDIKQSVFIWYIGFRSYIPQRCPALFSGKKSKRAFNPREYVNGMVHQLTDGNITLKRRMLKQPVWDALDELEARAVEYEQMTQKK